MTVYVIVRETTNEFVAVFGTFAATLLYIDKHEKSFGPYKVIPVGIAR